MFMFERSLTLRSFVPNINIFVKLIYVMLLTIKLKPMLLFQKQNNRIFHPVTSIFNVHVHTKLFT